MYQQADSLSEESIACPYCGEQVELLVNIEDMEQEYIEDCQVCCRPITLVIRLDAQGVANLSAYDENDTGHF